MTEIDLNVTGYPAPQGSKKAWVNKATGRAQMREQSSDKIHLWRQDVKAAAQHWIDGYRDTVCDHDYTPCPFCVWGPVADPIDATIWFYFPRPKSHFRTGRHAHLMRDNAPAYPTTRASGDVDKLIRATLDALCIAGMFLDDAQVVHVDVWKIYVLPPNCGARIRLRTRSITAAELYADDEDDEEAS